MCHAPAPRGLLEGIADYVPLMAGEPMPEYGPRPSRSSERADNWDAGYMATAYFLEWIDRVGVGSGAIGLLNAQIGKIGYHRDGEDRSFLCGRKQPDTWRAIYGRSVDDLWEAYGLYLDGETDLDPVNPPIGTTGASWDERSIGLLSTIILVTIPVALEFVGYFNWG
ncbi:hypothetical protein N7478_009568 [Penicillium angulare]|uniref:uncharacterized protein n=1 Tax=Penicillium angulare TaxID=116970 RepID=UPI0025418661|nr:uncharacterized protein N7478_009568 [Penicillium angulare]KAJ5266760.1 hypothetical protein N7478_009568 [Penicillium angulare]